mmetsp:Transcript_28252/g.34517  ORF Transcript_28252/g.34517 Transcript_28252/m.34517 type:complete len:243 (+) Transcript_28252:31-759(+)
MNSFINNDIIYSYKPGRKPLTYENFRNLISGYIRQFIGKMPINDICKEILIFYPKITFKFEKHNSRMLIYDNGKSIKSLRSFCTILFGDFLNQKEKIIYTATFKSITAEHSRFGVGFATNKFRNFKANSWNTGGNHSHINYYGDCSGYESTKDFGRNRQPNIKNCPNKLKCFDIGYLIHFTIDMKNSRGIVKTQKNENEKDQMTIIDLCWKGKLSKYDGICICFTFGMSNQSLTLINQDCSF